MGIRLVEFEVIYSFTINIPIENEDYVDKVTDDIATIVKNYDVQFEDMITGSRKSEMLTEHGYRIRMIKSNDVRLSSKGVEVVQNEIDQENMRDVENY